jgi:hypothetical protein
MGTPDDTPTSQTTDDDLTRVDGERLVGGQDLPRLSLDYSETAALIEARIRLEADVREFQYRIKRALELLEGDTFGNIQAAIIVLSGQ